MGAYRVVRKLARQDGVRDHRRMIERRHRRSDNQAEAMQLLLEAHRDRLCVRTLVVMSGGGRVLASAGEAPTSVASAITADAAEARGRRSRPGNCKPAATRSPSDRGAAS